MSARADESVRVGNADKCDIIQGVGGTTGQIRHAWQIVPIPNRINSLPRELRTTPTLFEEITDGSRRFNRYEMRLGVDAH